MKRVNAINLLVADDDPDDQICLREGVDQSNLSHCRVDSVYNGVQLLEYLRSPRIGTQFMPFPDAIILDLNMPFLNGIEVLKEIKGDAVLKTIPIFILTSEQRSTSIELCFRFGCSGYYNKPAKVSDYVTLIMSILRRLENLSSTSCSTGFSVGA